MIVRIHRAAVVVIRRIINRAAQAHQTHKVQVAAVDTAIAQSTQALTMDRPHLTCIHIHTVIFTQFAL